MKQETTLKRRAPKQERSRQTVEVVLEAVHRVVERQGIAALTTNRIAEAAGVSIGSLYQYFPDKQAIFAALHDRHVEEVRDVIARAMNDCRSASLDEFTCELLEGLTSVHTEHAAVHGLLSDAVPGSARDFNSSLQDVFEHVISRAEPDRRTADEAKRMLFVLPHMVEALVHGVARENRPTLSRGAAKDEALRTVRVYLDSCRPSHRSHY